MTQSTPPELQRLIESHVKGFNEQDRELFLSWFDENAIIVDGIAPYYWASPNAPANWWTDCEKWRKNLGVTYEHLDYKMGLWAVEGSAAYAVISGTLTVKTKSQTMVRNGLLTYTLANRGGSWRIGAQAWGRTT
jgi:hypothetical protein